MRSLAFLVCCTAFVGILHSSWSFVVEGMISSAQARTSMLTEDKPSYLSRSVTEEIREVFEGWKRLANFASSLPEVHYQLGRASLVFSLLERSYERKIEHFCRAGRYFREAAQRSPHNASYHIAWADVASHIPSESLCAEGADSKSLSFSKNDARQRLEWARTLAPFSTNDLYFASIVYLGLGDKTQALSLLRLTEEINPRFNQAQREYFFRLITTKEELEQALPAKYPEVLHWVSYFSRYRRKDYLSWQGVFVKAVNESVSELEDRFRLKKVSAENFSYFMKTIHALPLVSHSERLRRRLDQALANVYEVEGNVWWAQVLRERQRLQRLPVLKALIQDDKRPRETMLFGWVPDEETRVSKLDFLGRSHGVFVPRGKILKLLIIQNRNSSARLSEDLVEFLWSEDNLNFHTFNAPEIETGIFDGKEALVVRFPDTDFRFLKIRYLGSNRQSRFVNALSDLIQAYGEVVS